MRKVLQPSSAG